MKRTEAELLLPGVFQRTVTPGSPLGALLDVMEALHQPAEDVLTTLDAYFDPHRTTDDFVPYLARWLDLEWLMVSDPGDPLPSDFVPLASGTGRLRELIAAAVPLSRVRGTARGLVRFLEIATGVEGFTVDEQVPGADGRPRPFHLRVRVPAAGQPYAALVRRIVDAQKPAYVTYEIELSAALPSEVRHEGEQDDHGEDVDGHGAAEDGAGERQR